MLPQTDPSSRFSSKIDKPTNLYHNGSMLITSEPIMSVTDQLENLTAYYKENRDTFKR